MGGAVGWGVPPLKVSGVQNCIDDNAAFEIIKSNILISFTEQAKLQVDFRDSAGV